MNQNKDIIQSLVNENTEIHYTSFAIPFAKSITFSLAYVTFMGFLFYNLREDITLKASNNYFNIEITSIGVLYILISYLAFKNLSPYTQKTKTNIACIIMLFMAFVGTALLPALPASLNFSNIIQEAHCAGTMTLISLPNIMAGFYFLKKQMTTHPKTLGFAIFSYSALLGYLLVRFTCENETLDHQSILHITPFILYSSLGIYFGNKHLKW